MKQLLTFLLSFSLYFVAAQNIVPNPDFENLSSCPTQLDDFPVSDWIVPTTGTSDYFHSCGGVQVDVPDNIFGSQPSATGDAYAGVMIFIESTFYREYIQVELETPTIAGGCYDLSLYYSRADQTGSCDGLGMLLSDGAPTNLTGQVPQLMKTNTTDNSSLWEVLSIQYVSPGGETHLTVGNFNTDANTQFTPGNGLFNDYAYYYIDSVAVEFVANESTDFTVDLGPDMEVCVDDFPVTLTSSLPNAINVWSTGEVGPSITVDAVGEYFVESYISCEFAKDSVTISLLAAPEFDVTDEIVCSGESTTISVDASLGSYVWEDGSSGSEFVVTDEGSYAVTLTYQCGELVDQFDVSVIEQINIPEPTDLLLCASDLPILISDFLSFDDGINEFLWQDGSESPGIIVFDEGLYSLEIYNNCFSDFVDFNVEIQSGIPAAINFTDTISCAGEDVLIDLGLFGYNFLWQDGSSLPFFLAPGPGEYSVTVSNLCGTEVFDFEIDEAIQETLELGEDISICPGDSVLISAPDGQDLMWSNGDVSSEIWIKEEGEIIAFFDGLCSQISDTINIFLNGAEPQIELPDSLLVCIGDTINLFATQDELGVEFTWSTGSSEVSIPIFQEGLFIVSGENNCGIVTDSVVVSLGESLPDPILDDTYEICQGDTIDLQVATNGGSVIWSTGSTDSSIQAFEEGSYFVSLTNSCTTKADTLAVVFTQELNALDLGPDFGICDGDSTIISASTFDGSYVWSTGSEEEQITIDEVGFYSLQINGACNSIYDTVEVTSLGSNPLIDLGADLAICEGDSIIIDIGTAVVDELIWNTSSIENAITVFAAGTYIVVGNNACGSDSDTIEVEINNEVPQIDLGDDQQICPGDSVTLDLGTVAGEITWNTGAYGPSIEVFEGGEYFAVLTSSCGISDDTILVELLEAAPEVDLGDDQTLCFGESLDFDLLVGDETTVDWSDGENTSENSFQESGLIWASLTNACGTDGDTVMLQIIPEVSEINMGDDVLVCNESSYLISPFIFDFNVDFEWNTGEIAEQIEVSEGGEYWLQVSNACFVQSDTVMVTFGTGPTEFDFGENDTICFGENILLEEDQGAGFLYNWQDNSSNTAIIATESGSYELVISNDCGMVSDQVDILVLPSEEIEFSLDENYLLCADVPLEIDLSDIVADFIEWNDGSTESIRLLTSPGNYEIKLENICADTLISFLFEQENCTEEGAIFIPNSFTPNGDGVNDLFQIFISENWLAPEVKVSIYNRWGEQILYSEDTGFTWDGTFKGSAMNAGVFAYYIELDVEIGGERKRIQKTGDITIIK